MASVIPVAKSLYLCDDILSDPARIKPHLIGVLNAIRVPAFPHVLPRLCVFAKLSDGFGDVRCRVRIVDVQDLTAAFETSERTIHFRDRRQILYAMFKIEKLRFLAPGEFVVELFCNDEFVDDAVLMVVQ
jgi:hypothetical protein